MFTLETKTVPSGPVMKCLMLGVVGQKCCVRLREALESKLTTLRVARRNRHCVELYYGSFGRQILTQFPAQPPDNAQLLDVVEQNIVIFQ